MTDVANLNLKVDATSVDAGTASLKNFKTAGREAQEAAQSNTSATQQMADAIRSMEAAYKAEFVSSKASASQTLENAKAAQTNASATGQLSAAIRMTAEDYRKLTAGTNENTSATKAASSAQQQITDAIRAGRPVTAQAIRDAGGLANAMKIMEAAHHNAAGAAKESTVAHEKSKISLGGLQIQTATFTRELLVLGREAGRGDWNRFAGSLTILGQAMGLTSVLATGAGLAFLGAGAAIAGVIAIIAAGQKEFHDLENAMVVTGNYAGMTADKFEDMAKRTATANKVSIGTVKGALQELTASGKFTGETIGLMADNAIKFSKYTGQSAEDVVKNYETMKGGVVRWAVKHSEVYHDLTLAQIDYIDALEKAGKHSEAERQLMMDISDTIKDRSVPAYGWLQTALHGVTAAAGNMWDALLGVGRPKTLADQIADSKQLLASMDTPYNRDAAGGSVENTSSYRAQKLRLGVLEMLQKGVDDKAAADAKKAQEEDDKIRKKYDNQGFRPRFRGPVDRVGNEIENLKAEVQANRDLADAYDVSTAAGFKAAAMKKALVTAAKLHTDASKFEALELDAAVTKAIATGYQSLAQDKERISSQVQVNDLMQRTGISQTEANQRVKDELELKKLQAAADNASGSDKQRALRLIEETKDAQAQANALAREAVVIDQTNNQKAVNADLDAQLGLMNATNRERNVALAILQAKRDLEKQGVHDFGSDTSKGFIAERVKTANKQTDIADGVGDAIKQQQFYLTLLDKMTARTHTAASDMAGAFGSIGESLADLTTILADYSQQQVQATLEYAQAVKDADGDQEKLSALAIDRKEAQRATDLKYYGDVSGSAASFFDKQTAAYKTLHGVETVFRAMEFANSARAVAVKAAEVAGKLPLYASEAIAAAQVGAANMFASLGPLGFAAVAGMVAVLAGMGISGLSGGNAHVNNVKEEQANQGAGTVFGDSSAKSESISKSLELATRNSNQLLEYTSDMVSSLHNIESSLGAVTNSIIRLTGTGGALNGSNFDVGTSTSGPSTLQKLLNPISAILPGLFGTKKTTSLVDQGLQFNDQNLGDLLDNGVDGNTFAQTLTKTKKKFLGVTVSNKSSTNTYTDNIGEDLGRQIQLLVGSLRDSVVSAATALGVEGAKALLDTFNIQIGTISFQDMDGEEIAAALESVFSKVGDQMAESLIPGLVEFQKAGEGTMETLVRVARDYQVVDTTLASIGKTFGAVGLASIAAREKLIGLAGSLDDFVDQAEYFSTNFLSEAEQLAPVSNAVSLEMHRLGLDAIKTKDQFKALVLGLDLTTSGGQAVYAALMKVAPAFDKVASSAVETAQAAVDAADDLVSTWTDNLLGAYKEQSDVFQETIGRLTKVTEALRKYNDQLNNGPEAMLSPQDQYFSTRDAFDQTYAAAQGGDQTAIDNLQTVSEAYLAASKSYYASTGPYFQDLRRVKDAVASTLATAEDQLSAAEASQVALDKLVNEALTANGILTQVKDGVVNTSGALMSVADAIAGLAAATNAQAAAQAAAAAATAASNQAVIDAINAANQTPSVTTPTTSTPTSTTPTNASPDWDSYLEHYPDVMAEYNRLSKNNLKNNYGITTAEQFAAWHYSTNGQSEGRTPYKAGGIMDRPITLGESGIGGEAGPEGILPLANVGGKMGVHAASDNETKELLREMIALLNGANQQRAQQAQEQAANDAKQLAALDAQKRATRANAR